jgi:putative ABC transport system permease protein
VIIDTVHTITLRTLLTALAALRALHRNKLRSSLTALGIIIGVFAVIAMVSIGNGAKASIETQISGLGQNMLVVFAGSRRSGGANSGLGSASAITLQDAEALRLQVPDVVALSPDVSTSAQAVANGRNWFTNIAGESPEFTAIRDWTLSSGSMFTDREVRGAAKVAVIGSKTAHELFGPLDPVGQTVRIKNIPFVVIGVLASKGAGLGGQNQDDQIIIPFSTAMKRLTGDKYLRTVTLEVRDAAHMGIAQDQITRLLRQRHRLLPGDDDDFNIFNQKEIADTVDAVTSSLTLLLGAIAGLSLLVGGIGIMNIMLVSVTERTREIGIRISVGARPGDIRTQFLIEAVTLSLLGGLVGVLLGIGAAALISAATTFKAIVSLGSIVLAFTVSFMIGVFFGFYPARRASILDPIEALRYE